MSPNDQFYSEFAAFLDRVAASTSTAVDWQMYAITHYTDPALEEMRRRVVRLSISWQGREWPEYNRDLLAEWSRQLRAKQ